MKNEFVNSAGRAFRLRPVSQTLVQLAANAAEEELREQGLPLEPPTYTTEIGEVLPHDEKSVRTEEEKALWAAHIAAKERLDAVQVQAKTRALLEGIEFSIPAEDVDPWRARQRRATKGRVQIPTDEDKLYEHYLWTEVLLTPEDLISAIELVTLISYRGAVDEEKVRAAMNSFRIGLQRHTSRLLDNQAGQLEA